MTDETQQAQTGASQNPDLSNLAANLAKGKPNLFSDLTGLQKTALFAVPTAIAGGIIGILIFLLTLTGKMKSCIEVYDLP